MLVVLLLCQPMPYVPSIGPAEVGAYMVDIIIVNQYNRTYVDGDDEVKTDTTFYVSFWTVHTFPPWGMCRGEFWCHRGWTRDTPVFSSAGGVSAMYDKRAVTAPVVLFIASDFDLEYANRWWQRPISEKP